MFTIKFSTIKIQFIKRQCQENQQVLQKLKCSTFMKEKMSTCFVKNVLSLTEKSIYYIIYIITYTYQTNYN